jgi:hypothetical protein
MMLKCRVRYGCSSGMTPWIECLSADVRDGFLVIRIQGGWTYIPAHAIAGEVQVQFYDPADDH